MKNLLHRAPLALVVVLALLLHSCIQPEQIQLSHIQKIEVKGITPSEIRLDAEIEAANLSSHKVELQSAQIKLNHQAGTLLIVNLSEGVTLPRKYNGTLSLPISIHPQGGFMGMLILAQHINNNFASCSISAEAVVKGGWAKKTIHIENMSCAEAARILNIDLSKIIQEVLNQ